MAGTKQTNAEAITWFNTNVNTNGIQGITGAILNEGFNNLVYSVLLADTRRGRNISLTAGVSNVITFDTPFAAGAVYTIIPFVRDSSGNRIDETVVITNQTITQFTCALSVTGKLDYVALEKY